MSFTLHDIKRRRDGKRINERLKLLANLLNITAAGTIGGGLIVPWVTSAQFHPAWNYAPFWFLAAVAHIAAQVILGFLMSED